MKFQSLNNLVFGFIGLAGLLGGCAAQPNQDEITAKYWRARTHVNGLKLNGIESANGVGVNGIGVNGIGVNGVGVNGISVDKGVLISVEDSLEGEFFIGTKLLGYPDYENFPGDYLTMKITGYTAGTGSTPALYTIQEIAETSENVTIEHETPRDICGIDPLTSQQIPVVMFNGIWDSSSGEWSANEGLFTMACANASIGKCGLWYYPELTKQEYNGETPDPEPEAEYCLTSNATPCKPRALSAWHAACIRMVRADYCGDGYPHTKNGTPINIWDGVGIEAHGEAIENFTSEAEWGTDGAHCIQRTRWFKSNEALPADILYVQNGPNDCYKRLYHDDDLCSSDNDCGNVTDACRPGGYCQCIPAVGMDPGRCRDGFTCNENGHCVTNAATCTTESNSHFYTVHGFGDESVGGRPLLRNETGPNPPPS